MKITPESHVDHDITPAQMLYLLRQFAGETGFFIKTVELPAALGTVPCALYGPVMGDPPVPDTETFALTRGERPYTSRCVKRPLRPVTSVTVIAGPHDTEPCVLYTAFGGPLAPKEPFDPTLATATPANARLSVEFWADHALAVYA